MKKIKIIRSKRKTIGIYIMPDASVEVRCPRHTDEQVISDLIKEKSEWIAKNVAEKNALLESKNNFSLSTGALIYFLGKPLTIKISHVHRIDADGFYISGKDLRQSAVQLYRKYAKTIISKKVQHFSKIMNAHPVSVNINSASTRWGSCGAKNTLNFSWKLIIADELAVDYVVVHELAHTFEHNHSARFWSIVRQHMPDYKQRKQFLDDAQKIISIQGW